jgi:2-hydroxychromene-2-carboxylate isomerase
MKTLVTVYTDYKSPYAFIAKAASYELEERHDVELDWLPYTLDIADYLDPVESRSPHHWRRVRYSYMDARRYANKQGLVLKGPQRIFDGYYSSTGMLYAKRHGFFRQYNDTVFERFWRRELEIDVLDEICGVIQDLGHDPEGFRDYAEAAGRKEHAAIRNEAEARGVFGVPTFVLDGELFWGGDRIALLIERLEERASAKP